MRLNYWRTMHQGSCSVQSSSNPTQPQLHLASSIVFGHLLWVYSRLYQSLSEPGFPGPEACSATAECCSATHTILAGSLSATAGLKPSFPHTRDLLELGLTPCHEGVQRLPRNSNLAKPLRCRANGPGAAPVPSPSRARPEPIVRQTPRLR